MKGANKMNNNYFQELSLDSEQELNGGFLLELIIGVVGTIAYVAGDQYCENKTGKGIGEWAVYGTGYVIDKVGEALSAAGEYLQN